MPNSKEYMRQYMAKRRSDRREKLIDLKGGECVQCGSKESLELDHIDPSTMSFRLDKSSLTKSWQSIVGEAEKCQLLCRSCHADKSSKEGSLNNSGGKGSQSHHSKLSLEDVKEIFRLREEETFSHQEIADTFDVSRRTIGNVLDGTSGYKEQINAG